MRMKKTIKKLALNKATIINLNTMANIRGGIGDRTALAIMEPDWWSIVQCDPITAADGCTNSVYEGCYSENFPCQSIQITC